ncbi:MAG: transcription factor S [Candidatus Heimdallarchaeota archaeon]
MVSFCKNCGSLLLPQRKDDGKVILYCKVCDTKFEDQFTENSYQVKSKIRHTEEDLLTVIEDQADFDIRPTTRIACPRCSHHEARYWEAENRKKEEWETTTYYKCTACNWVWSE